MTKPTVDRFDAMDTVPSKGMVYLVHIESYDPMTGTAKNTTFKVRSLAEAEAVVQATDLVNSQERTVTVEPDVLSYLELYHPGSLDKLWPRSH